MLETRRKPNDSESHTARVSSAQLRWAVGMENVKVSSLNIKSKDFMEAPVEAERVLTAPEISSVS